MLVPVRLNQSLVLGVPPENGPSHGAIETSTINKVAGLTPEETLQLQNDFAYITANGNPDNLEKLFVGQFLRQIISGERKDASKSLYIKDTSLGILNDRYIEGKQWKNIGAELRTYPRDAVVSNGGHNAETRGRIAVRKIIQWLEPLGATQDAIKEVLSSLSKVKAETKQRFSEAMLTYQGWLESFNSWLKGTVKEVKPIDFNLRDKKTAPAFLDFIKQLKIKLDYYLKAGRINPVKSEHGFVLEATREDGKNFHRYLMAYNSGELLTPPKKYSRYKFLADRNGRRFDIFKLVYGFGPVDLIRALHNVRVFSQFNKEGKPLCRRLDLRLHKDNFGSEIPIPLDYTKEFLQPHILPEDLEKGIKRVTFFDPESNEPVIEVILTYTEKGYESNYLGKYANPLPNNGPLNKAGKDINEFLSGERLTPPHLEKFQVHENRGSRFIRISHQAIRLTKYLPEGVNEVNLRFVRKGNKRLLKLYAPDTKPNAKPLATLRSNNGIIELVE